mgnify:FL=1
MSKYTFKTAKYNVQVGVDRPLRQVFASIFVNGKAEKAAKNFDPFTWFDVSDNGVTEAVEAVTQYIRKNDNKNFEMPKELVDMLKQDVQTNLRNPLLSLNQCKCFGDV